MKATRLSEIFIIIFSVVLTGLSLAFFFLIIYHAWDIHNLLDRPTGLPLVADFANFWSAARLTLTGDPAAIYDICKLHGLEINIFGGSHYDGCGWYYPPTFMLFIAPLGFFSYLHALFIWIITTFVFYLIVLRCISPNPLILFLGIGFPGSMLNILFGQNGFLSASLLGGGLLLLDRSPILAGFLIGCLSYKPHFVILTLSALAVGGYWRVFLTAMITALVLAFSSLLIFGLNTWIAFFSQISVPLHLLEIGYASWQLIPSFFSAVLSLDYGVHLAYLIHVIIMMFAIGATFWVWWKRNDLIMRSIVLVLATLLVTPYLFIYDLPLLALPLAWLWEKGSTTEKVKGERLILLLGWLMPLATIYIWDQTIINQAKLQLGPVVILGILLLSLIKSKNDWIISKNTKSDNANYGLPPLSIHHHY